MQNCPVSITDLPAGNPDVEFVNIATTGFYWPAFGINSIQQPEPGKGYFIKTELSQDIEFPDCSSKAMVVNSNETGVFDAPWPTVQPIPLTHVIAIPGDVVKKFDKGDYV